MWAGTGDVEYGDDFEWDPNKAEANAARHGVTFEETSTVFDDEWALTVPDDAHSQEEIREFTIGRSAAGRLLAVAHTQRGDRIRIINARVAESPERRQYADEDR